MDQKILRYVIIAFVSSIIFNLIPQQNNPIKDMWLFIAFIILIYYLLDTNGIIPVSTENFENIKLFKSSGKSGGLKNANKKINIKDVSSNDISNNEIKITDISKNETKIEEDKVIDSNKNETKIEKNKITDISKNNISINKGKLLPAGNKINIKNIPKLDLISQPTLTELEDIENRINSLKNDDKTKLLSQLNINYKSSQDCDCETKIQDAVEKYLNKGKYIDDRGIINNLLEGDMRYNQLDPSQMQPLGSYDKTFTNKWDHGFTYLSTDKWAPPRSKPPACKTEKNCPVCPNNTPGYPLNLLEFDNSLKIMGPDEINVKYINERLNK